MSKKTPQPDYHIGDVIVSKLYMGKIVSAFFDKGKWNYGIGPNAGDFDVIHDGYRIGDKFIVEDEIIWWCKPGDKELKDA